MQSKVSHASHLHLYDIIKCGVTMSIAMASRWRLVRTAAGLTAGWKALKWRRTAGWTHPTLQPSMLGAGTPRPSLLPSQLLRLSKLPAILSVHQVPSLAVLDGCKLKTLACRQT